MQLRPGKKLRNIKRGRFKTKLPDVVLTRVFQFATRSLRDDFFTYMSVCTKWYRCSANYPVLKFLRPILSKLKDRDCLTLSERCKSLGFLDLLQGYITDAGLRALSSLSSLSYFKLFKLSAHPTAVTSDGLQALGALTQLKTLCIYGVCDAEQHGLKLGFVTKLKCLRELRLDGSKITDVGLAGLEGTSSLTTLSLSICRCTVTTPALLRVARHLNELQNFTYDSDAQIDIVAVVRALPKHRSLRELHLGANFDDATALAVRDACPGLTSLSVNSSFTTDVTTDISIRAIGDLTCLTNLSLNDLTDCTDDGLCALSNLVHLRTLDLGWTEIGDLALSSFAPLVKLESLDLRWTDITGTAFRDLAGLTVLHKLDLRGCIDLTDDGILECARAFTALRHLALGSEVVSDYDCLTSAAWRHLAAHASPTLTHVDTIAMGLTPADVLVLARFQGRRD